MTYRLLSWITRDRSRSNRALPRDRHRLLVMRHCRPLGLANPKQNLKTLLADRRVVKRELGSLIRRDQDMAGQGSPPGLSAYLVSQARNNHWSNHRLHTACSRLPASEYFASRPSFFGSIHAHLDHIVFVDWLYLERLTGKRFLPDDVGDLLHREFAPLAEDQLAAGRALIDFCQSATPDTPCVDGHV